MKKTLPLGPPTRPHARVFEARCKHATDQQPHPDHVTDIGSAIVVCHGFPATDIYISEGWESLP